MPVWRVGRGHARLGEAIGDGKAALGAGAVDKERASRAGRLRRITLFTSVVGFALSGLLWCAPAFADTTTSVAPGLSIFTSLESWIEQYGLAGAPLAICFGGLVMVIEHHQQRTGNAIRAKGYIVAACLGLFVIGLSGTIVSAITAIAGL